MHPLLLQLSLLPGIHRLEKWNKFNCISQSILIAQFTSKLLTYANLNDDIIMCFHDFLIEKKGFILNVIT